jgi:hypothetical protein
MTSHAKSSPLPLAANLQLFVFTSECQLAIEIIAMTSHAKSFGEESRRRFNIRSDSRALTRGNAHEATTGDAYE